MCLQEPLCPFSKLTHEGVSCDFSRPGTNVKMSRFPFNPPHQISLELFSNSVKLCCHLIRVNTAESEPTAFTKWFQIFRMMYSLGQIVTTAQLCCCSKKAASDNTFTSGYDCSNESLFTKIVGWLDLALRQEIA